MLALPPLFGRFLERTGKVPEQAIRAAIQLQEELAGSLLETAMLEGALTLDQVHAIKRRQRDSGALLDDAIVALGHLDRAALGELKQRHERAVIPLGEALVARGSITEAQLAEFLREFEKYKES